MEIKSKEVNGHILFEVYSIFIALGYTKLAKGKLYPRKDKIEKLLKNIEISPTLIDNERFVTIDDVRKIITFYNGKGKLPFISWFQSKGYISYNEVFDSERKETIFFDRLKQILQPMRYTLVTQYIDGRYRLDGYIKELDMVIEYDENNHDHYDQVIEQQRESYIKSRHKHLIRINDLHDIYYNIGIVMNKILHTVSN